MRLDKASGDKQKVLEKVKYEETKVEEPLASQTTGELSDSEKMSEIFMKHRIGKLKEYTNFNHKEGYLDTYDFSWDIHGYDIFSKFLPITTKLITSQFNLAFRMTKR